MLFSPAPDTSYTLRPHILLSTLSYRPQCVFTLKRETMFHTHMKNSNYHLRPLKCFTFKFSDTNLQSFVIYYMRAVLPAQPNVPYLRLFSRVQYKRRLDTTL